MPRFELPRFAYRRPAELDGAPAVRHPVAIVGAGPVGLAAAVDLARHGIASVLLDDDDTVSTGSRAICWSARTLEIFDRLGIGARVLAKGVTWKVGRVYHRDREIWSFDLQPEPGRKMPPFVNLQQYHVEQYLVDRCAAFPELVDLRWRNRVTGLSAAADGVELSVETPDGHYRLNADWLIAADGARSTIRSALGLRLAGQRYRERFLIADIEMRADFPGERRFWFEPPFHDGRSALLHKQPDDIWRIDLQLGADADPAVEADHARVVPRIRAIVGDRPFDIDWVSVYGFQCSRLERFVHGRVVFAGDAAHVVSPFGARGGNGGIQDVDNLCWKLAAVLNGEAPQALIATYDEERGRAAGENILNSSRSTAFMTPKTAAERRYGEAVLALAADMPFARRLVNSGRLSTPCSLAGLSLQTPAESAEGILPGDPCPDVPLRDGGRDCWLSERLGGRFVLLAVGERPPPDACGLPVVHVGPGGLDDTDGLAARRYGSGVVLLVRPDQHVAARFDDPSPADVAAAHRRALAASPQSVFREPAAPAPRAGRAPQDIGLDRLGPRADDVYAALVEAHRDRMPDRAAAFDARLVLLLANLAADPDAVIDAIRAASAGT